jgi:transcriptional regulator with XRE-family HTH domain
MWILNGAKIWSHRNYAGLTQAEAAKKAGISQSAVSRLERGRGTIGNLLKLSAALDCHPGIFITGFGTKDSPFDSEKNNENMQEVNISVY